MTILTTVFQYLSNLAIPALILIFLISAYRRKLKMYELFVDGAKEGFNVAVRIIPPLVGIFLAISIFRFSGAMAVFRAIVRPITEFIRMPGDLIPLALMRPLSGGGALGITSEIIATHGADSLAGFMASVMQASTDTTFYVIAVYFGAVGISKQRHALAAGLFADACGLLMAVIISNAVIHLLM